MVETREIYIRGFREGRIIWFRIYDNLDDFKNNWDQGIGTYKNVGGCCDAICQISEDVRIAGFEIPGNDRLSSVCKEMVELGISSR